MNKLVARLNIEHYRKELIKEVDDARRQTLLQLLAEEQAKLAAMQQSPPTGKRRG